MPRQVWFHITALLLTLSLLNCGAALQLTGEETAEGAVEGIEEELDVSQQELLTQRLAARAARGALEALSDSLQLRRIAQILAATGAGTLEGAAGMGLDGYAVDGTAPIEQVSALAAEAFARALAQEIVVQLGPRGDGPLTRSIAAAVNEVVAAAAIGVPYEALFFPECRGETRQRCIEQRLSALSRAATTGATRGAIQAIDLRLLILGILIGLAAALLGVLVWHLLHTGHATPGAAQHGQLRQT
ncbi:MAG: hypothetical protein GF331_05145 [Chitinivibrionales bacterium]|nr:hypothetical protein [Chitinivibrionales bacterium]